MKTILSALVALSVAGPALAGDQYVIRPLPYYETRNGGVVYVYRDFMSVTGFGAEDVASTGAATAQPAATSAATGVAPGSAAEQALYASLLAEAKARGLR